MSPESSLGLTRGQRFAKRGLDLVVAALGLILLWPVILLAWLVAAVDTRANGFFIQQRVGRNGELFRAVKIRTMRVRSAGTTVTVRGDSRITESGRFFRRFKIDELPQLWNVLKGSMSLVGPRPDVPGYADQLKGEDRLVLAVRPGITGPATLKYRDEESVLASVPDSEAYNRIVIFPDKVRINVDYVRNYSLGTDFRIVWLTLSGK